MDTQQAPDTIFLHELKVETIIGIWDWERKIRQTVSIDLEMGTDIRRAAETDSIDDTLNYKAVAKRVCKNSRFRGSRCASVNPAQFAVRKMSVF